MGDPVAEQHQPEGIRTDHADRAHAGRQGGNEPHDRFHGGVLTCSRSQTIPLGTGPAGGQSAIGGPPARW